MTNPSDCTYYEDDLAALALGTVTGRPRAAVIAHVETCRACEVSLKGLSSVGDRLLDLAPSAAPPRGFEDRVLSVMRGARPSPVPLRRRRPALVAAAALVVAVGLTAGILASQSGSPSNVVALHEGARTVGELSVRVGNPARLAVHLDGLHQSGPVDCLVTDEHGRSVMVGIFWVYDGQGSWSVTLPFPARDLRSATITTRSGAILARGSL